MALNNYTALTQGLPAQLDCATSDIASVLAEIIDSAEKRIFRELRTPEQEQALSINISAGAATVPTDYVELRYAYVDANPVQEIKMVPLSYIYERYPTRASQGKPVCLARDGANFVFGPYPDSNYVIRGTYYKQLSTIGAGTNNALLTKYDDVYRYATLIEAESFLGRDNRIALWEQKYRFVKELVNGEADRSRFSGNLQIRPANI